MVFPKPEPGAHLIIENMRILCYSPMQRMGIGRGAVVVLVEASGRGRDGTGIGGVEGHGQVLFQWRLPVIVAEGEGKASL